MDHNIFKSCLHYFPVVLSAVLIPLTQPVLSQSIAIQPPTSTDSKPDYQRLKINLPNYKTISHNSLVTRPELQQGSDGTMYLVHYDFRRGQENINSAAYGREYWTSPYVKHPNYGIRYVYLVDRSGNRVTPKLYIENKNGELTSKNQ